MHSHMHTYMYLHTYVCACELIHTFDIQTYTAYIEGTMMVIECVCVYTTYDGSIYDFSTL